MLDYSRNQDARHARCAHLWGIADGLNVKVLDGNLEVGEGMAVDSSGAAVILTDKTILTPDQFQRQLTNGEDSGFFPLFVIAHHDVASGRRLNGSCGEAKGHRENETGRLKFDRLSSLVDWDTRQNAPVIAKGPDSSVERRVLLGFVEWDKPGRKFKSFQKKHLTYQVRYLGARAETVESTTGQMTLRIKSRDSKDVALVYVDLNDAKQMFAFGLEDGRGGINRVFTVDKDGNVTAKGVISGAAPVTPGTVLVHSGKATDGIHLPLPPGITLEQVSSGAVVLHIMVTPRFEDSEEPMFGGPWLPKVAECSVNPQTLKVQCRLQWFDWTSGAAPVFLGGVCDYLLIATVVSSGGAP
jgi:hypothetical protein